MKKYDIAALEARIAALEARLDEGEEAPAEAPAEVTSTEDSVSWEFVAGREEEEGS